MSFNRVPQNCKQESAFISKVLIQRLKVRLSSNQCFVSKMARGGPCNCGKWQASLCGRGVSAGGGCGRRSGFRKGRGRRRRRPEQRGARRWRPGPTLGSGAALRRAARRRGSWRGRGAGAELEAPHRQWAWTRAARLSGKNIKRIVGIFNLRPGQCCGADGGQ